MRTTRGAQRTQRRLSEDRGDTAIRARGPLIADAGPLYASYDADDAEHGTCRRLLETYPGPVMVPILVVTEVAYLLASRVGTETEVRFLGDQRLPRVLVLVQSEFAKQIL